MRDHLIAALITTAIVVLVYLGVVNFRSAVVPMIVAALFVAGCAYIFGAVLFILRKLK